jgi:hypothetical protein
MPVTSSPSPSRYRTWFVVRQELENTPAKGIRGTTFIGSSHLRNVNVKQSTPADSTTQRRTTSTSAWPTTVVDDYSMPKTTITNIPSSAEFDPMNRKLNFDSTESERKREAGRLAPDAPPFLPQHTT